MEAQVNSWARSLCQGCSTGHVPSELALWWPGGPGDSGKWEQVASGATRRMLQRAHLCPTVGLQAACPGPAAPPGCQLTGPRGPAAVNPAHTCHPEEKRPEVWPEGLAVRGWGVAWLHQVGGGGWGEGAGGPWGNGLWGRPGAFQDEATVRMGRSPLPFLQGPRGRRESPRQRRNSTQWGGGGAGPGSPACETGKDPPSHLMASERPRNRLREPAPPHSMAGFVRREEARPRPLDLPRTLRAEGPPGSSEPAGPEAPEGASR